MASQVDAVVMAVNATQTRQGSMDATLENLRRANRNILGFIWNQRITGPFSQNSTSQRYLTPLYPDSIQPKCSYFYGRQGEPDLTMWDMQSRSRRAYVIGATNHHPSK